jgi:hypothetical protein
VNEPFAVRTTPHFDRLLKKLARRHAELAEMFAHALAILESDPYNQGRGHPIKKLEGVAAATTKRPAPRLYEWVWRHI